MSWPDTNFPPHPPPPPPPPPHLQSNLQAWCTTYLSNNFPNLGDPTTTSACQVPAYASQPLCTASPVAAPTIMQQCMAEQKYVRDAMTRNLIYLQVCVRALRRHAGV